MARIAVVGGGFAGMSVAARLAKLRHEVVVFEAAPALGGRLHRYEIDGNRFALSPETVTLPGVLRDLFRKSGRPLERVAELKPAGPRRHLFATGESLELPFGDRADQHDAIIDALGEDEWSDWVDKWPGSWDVLRRQWLDQIPTSRDSLDRAAKRQLLSHRSLQRLVRRQLKDPALAKMVEDPMRLQGQDGRRMPALTAVQHYVERTFGLWQFDGGLGILAAALVDRLAERKVAVHTSTTVTNARAGHIDTSDGPYEADTFVWCAPPTAGLVASGLGPPRYLVPAIPACRTFVHVDESGADSLLGSARDIVVHGNPPMRLWRAGHGCLTLIHTGGQDPLRDLAMAGIDIRDAVLGQAHTVHPSDLVQLGHWGWQWAGFSSMKHWPGVSSQHHRYVAGAAAWPSGVLGGGSIEEIGMATAAIAHQIGPRPR